MSNIYVIQYGTTEILNFEFVQISNLLTKTYCEIHNFKYSFKNADDIPNTDKISDFNNILIKKLYIIYDILQQIKENDYLIYIDDDIFINLPNFDLTTFFEDKYQIYFSVDWQHEINKQVLSNISNLFNTKYNNNLSIYNFLKSQKILSLDLYHCLKYLVYNPYGINAGFIMLRKTDITIQYIKEAIDILKTNIVDCIGDQGVLSFLLLDKKYFDIFKILPKFTQNHPFIPEETGLKYNCDKTFLLHVYGQSENVRNYYANIILNKWKQLNIIGK